MKKKTSIEIDKCEPKRDWKSRFGFGRSEFGDTVTRDWAILFSISMLLLIGILFWSGMIFRDSFFLKERSRLLTGGKRESVINQMKLGEVVGRFETKKAHFEDLQKNPPAVVDPSK